MVCVGKVHINGVTYLSRKMDMAGHDSDFAFSWFDDAGTVGPDHSRFALREKGGLYTHHILKNDV